MTHTGLLVCFLLLEPGFTGEIDTQPSKHLYIHIGKDHGGVAFTAPEMVELLHSQFCRGIGGRTDGQCDQHLIRVKSGIAISQMCHFQMLNRLNGYGRYQLDIIGNAA